MVFVQLAVKRAPAHADLPRRQRAVPVAVFQSAGNKLLLRLFNGEIAARQRVLRTGDAQAGAPLTTSSTWPLDPMGRRDGYPAGLETVFRWTRPM